MTRNNLPFQVGDFVELRSFELGFRGAWFHCKITEIFKKGRELFYNLEYPDYPDQGIDEIKVFETFQGDENYLMIRPPYPRKCRENEVLNEEDGVEETLVVVPSVWKVGDLVDWYKDDCYWSGTLLKVRENGSVKVELWPEPYGEGKIYNCLSEDLRPSLEWSLEHGWTVPSSKDGEDRQCAKLVKPLMEEIREEEVRGEEQVSGEDTREEQVKGEEQEERQKLKGDGDLQLNIMKSDFIEAAVMDLEEQIVRIEWLQNMLAHDISNSSETSSWKYADYSPSSSRM